MKLVSAFVIIYFIMLYTTRRMRCPKILLVFLFPQHFQWVSKCAQRTEEQQLIHESIFGHAGTQWHLCKCEQQQQDCPFYCIPIYKRRGERLLGRILCRKRTHQLPSNCSEALSYILEDSIRLNYLLELIKFGLSFSPLHKKDYLVTITIM